MAYAIPKTGQYAPPIHNDDGSMLGVIKDEFTVKQNNFGKIEKIRDRVNKLFAVTITQGMKVNEAGVDLLWLILFGPSKEDNHKAKEYITTVCNTDSPMLINYPSNMTGVLLDSHEKIEQLSSSVVVFTEDNKLEVYGSDIAITLAMSSVEDILGQYLPDPGISVEPLNDPEIEIEEIIEVDADSEKTLTRQNSATHRLEAQLKLVCEQHDLSYEDYRTANNDVKRVLISWLSHDMDDVGEEGEDSDHSVKCIDEDSIICLDTPKTDSRSKCVSDSGISEITSDFQKIASPARSSAKAAEDASRSRDSVESVIVVSDSPPAAQGVALMEQSLLMTSDKSPTHAADTIRTFALSKGYTNVEIDIVLSTKTPPFRSSEIIVELYKNRHKPSNGNSVKESQIADAENPAVQSYLERLYGDFMEESPNLSREEYLKRNKERQGMLMQVFRPESGDQPTSTTGTSCQTINTGGNQNPVPLIDLDPPPPEKKKRKKKKKKGKNNNPNAQQPVAGQPSGSGSDSDPVIVYSNNTVSPVPHVSKKLRPKDKENEFSNIGQNSNNQRPGNNKQLGRKSPEELFREVVGTPPKNCFKFGAGFDWETEPTPPVALAPVAHAPAAATTSRSRSTNSESDVRELTNGSTIQAKKGQHLRPIVIDGSNVACAHGYNKKTFSCRGIQICINYFLARGHTEITAFVPNWRKGGLNATIPTTDNEIIIELERKGYVSFTPSRRIGKRNIVCYDDRFIVELASENGGVIVSNDNYRDLLEERNEKWKQVIEKRLLMYTFVGDRFMVPQDPLGKDGPPLDILLTKEEFLRRRRIPPLIAPPVQPLRSITVTRQLEHRLNSIFPGNDKIVTRILENHPYEEDLNKLSTHMLDVVQ